MGTALREVLAKFGFEITDTEKLDNAEKKADGFASKLKEMAAVLLGAALVDKIKGFVGEIQHVGDEMAKSAARIGVSSHELQKWRLAASMGGASAEDMSSAFKDLQKNAYATALAGGPMAGMFRKIGVSLKDSGGQMRTADSLMRDVAIGLSKLENPTERSTIAMTLLGEAGLKLIPAFSGGEKALDSALGTLDEFGGGLSDEVLPLTESLGDRITELDTSFLSLKSRLASSFFPTLILIVKRFAQWVTAFGKATDGTNAFSAAILVLGGIAAKVAITTYARYLPLIAGIALLVLLVDDLITAFKGGDSVIGKFLDKLFGKGGGRDFFKWISEGVDGFITRIEKMDSAGDVIEEIFSTLGFTLVKFFVDELPEFWDLWWRDWNKKARTGGKTMTDFYAAMFKDLSQDFKDWVEEITDDIIDGFVEGIKEKWDDVINSFEDLAKGIRNKFKEVFKINSPAGTSKEDVDDIAEGYIIQFAARAPDIEKSAEKAYRGALPSERSVYPATLSLPSAGGNQYASNVEIRQTNHNQITVTSNGNMGIANAARDGISIALNDDRNATLAALETVMNDEG